jgi:hypothetical protein
MEEKKLSGQESILIIQQMIQTAKQEQKDDGLGWIIWGWLLFAASVLTWFNMKFEWFSVYIFWNIFGIVAGLLLVYEVIGNFFLKKKPKVKTYTNDLFQRLNGGYFIFLMMIILSINLGVQPVKGFALLLGLYGFWILIYGTALNFLPSVIGAFICWGFGFAALFVKDHHFDETMILHSLAVLSGYIIPGHLAFREFKKINRTNLV